MLINNSKDPYGYNTPIDKHGKPNPNGRSTPYEKLLDKYYERYTLSPNISGSKSTWINVGTPSEERIYHTMYPKCKRCHKQMDLLLPITKHFDKKFLKPDTYTLIQIKETTKDIYKETSLGNQYNGAIYNCKTCKVSEPYTPMDTFSITCLELPTFRLDGSMLPTENHTKAITTHLTKTALPHRNNQPTPRANPTHTELHGLSHNPNECPTCLMTDGNCNCEIEGHADHVTGFQARTTADYSSYATRDQLLATNKEGDLYTRTVDKISHPLNMDNLSSTLYCASHWDSIYTLPTTHKPSPPKPPQVKTEPVILKRVAEKYSYKVPSLGNSFVNSKYLKHSKAEAGDTITVIIHELVTIDHLPVPVTPPPFSRRPKGKSLLPFIHSGQRHGV